MRHFAAGAGLVMPSGPSDLGTARQRAHARARLLGEGHVFETPLRLVEIVYADGGSQLPLPLPYRWRVVSEADLRGVSAAETVRQLYAVATLDHDPFRLDPPVLPPVEPGHEGPCLLELLPSARRGRGRWWRGGASGFTDAFPEAGVFSASEAGSLADAFTYAVDARAALDSARRGLRAFAHRLTAWRSP